MTPTVGEIKAAFMRAQKSRTIALRVRGVPLEQQIDALDRWAILLADVARLASTRRADLWFEATKAAREKDAQLTTPIKPGTRCECRDIDCAAEADIRGGQAHSLQWDQAPEFDVPPELDFASRA